MGDNKKFYYFSLGRNAIYAVLKILNISKNDEVLTPAWDCDSCLEPFRVVGCKPIFYRSNPYTFEVDLDHIKGLITSKTKLIHIINHFGQSQPWEPILQFRNDIGIPILEDNAYSFLSGIKGKKFGDFGDFSIFSLRKNLPIPDGGLLKINSDHKFNLKQNKSKLLYRSEFPFVINRMIFLMKQSVKLEQSSFSRMIKGQRYAPSNPLPLFSDNKQGFPVAARGGLSKDFAEDYLRPMSLLSKLVLKFYYEKKFDEIAKMKREYYRYLVGELEQQKGITLLHPKLREGVVPYCLNLLVGENRDKILLNLVGKKYPVMAWPTLPIDVMSNLEKYPEVNMLGTKLIQINLNPQYEFRVYTRLIKDFIAITS